MPVAADPARGRRRRDGPPAVPGRHRPAAPAQARQHRPARLRPGRASASSRARWRAALGSPPAQAKDQEPAARGRRIVPGQVPSALAVARPATLRDVRVDGLLKRVVGQRVAWLAVACSSRSAAAGHRGDAWTTPPGTGARAELTWSGDAEMAPALDAATAELAGARRRGGRASAAGARRALAQALDGRHGGLAGGDRRGDAQLRRDRGRWPRACERPSPTSRTPATTGRCTSRRRTPRALRGSSTARPALTDGPARRLGGLHRAARSTPAEPERRCSRATTRRPPRPRAGSRGPVHGGARALDRADATIAEARALRDQLANTVDVTDARPSGSTATPPTTRRSRPVHGARRSRTAGSPTRCARRSRPSRRRGAGCRATPAAWS